VCVCGARERACVCMRGIEGSEDFRMPHEDGRQRLGSMAGSCVIWRISLPSLRGYGGSIFIF
jgi:hypothetical protein